MKRFIFALVAATFIFAPLTASAATGGEVKHPHKPHAGNTGAHKSRHVRQHRTPKRHIAAESKGHKRAHVARGGHQTRHAAGTVSPPADRKVSGA